MDVNAAPERSWAYVADPSRLARWWPSVDRVDRPTEASYTRWVLSPRGRAVPMHFQMIELLPGEKVTWEQDLAETAFARSVRRSCEIFEVSPNGSGSAIRLTIQRSLRGTAMLGALFVARAQKRELKLAANALQEALA